MSSHAHAEHQRPLRIALLITSAVLVVEIAGGVLSRSLALLADAGHMLTDVAALGLGLFAFWLSARPPSSERTFGWRRFEIFAAFLNGVALWIIAAVIGYEAFLRLQSPQPVKGGLMLAVAVFGLAGQHRRRGGPLPEPRTQSQHPRRVPPRRRPTRSAAWASSSPPCSSRRPAPSSGTPSSAPPSASSSSGARAGSSAIPSASSWRARRPTSTSPPSARPGRDRRRRRRPRPPRLDDHLGVRLDERPPEGAGGGGREATSCGGPTRPSPRASRSSTRPFRSRPRRTRPAPTGSCDLKPPTSA